MSIIWQGKQSKCGYHPNVPVPWHSCKMMYLKHIQLQGSAAGWSVQHPGVDFIIRYPQERKSCVIGNPRNPLLTPKQNKLHYTMNHKPMQNMPTRFHIWHHFRPSIALTSSFANYAKSCAPFCSSSVRLLILWWRKGNKREREREQTCYLLVQCSMVRIQGYKLTVYQSISWPDMIKRSHIKRYSNVKEDAFFNCRW